MGDKTDKSPAKKIPSVDENFVGPVKQAERADGGRTKKPASKEFHGAAQQPQKSEFALEEFAFLSPTPSMNLMSSLLFTIGDAKYDFPEGAGICAFRMEDGTVLVAFTFGNEEEEGDDPMGAVACPAYRMQVADYLIDLLELAPDSVRINTDNHSISFPNKVVILQLLYNMVENQELFDLCMPELDMPPDNIRDFDPVIQQYVSKEEFPFYMKALYEAGRERIAHHIKSEAEIQRVVEVEGEGFDLYKQAPYKPYVSRFQLHAEIGMAIDNPFIVHLGFICELLKREGEKNLPPLPGMKKEFFTYGIN